MEEKFKSWMIRAEGKLESTAVNYSRTIHSLSEHYSSFTGYPTDIYTVDLDQLMQIKNSYESNGRFSEMGHESHGLNRAAIKAFYRFKLANPETLNAERKKPTTKLSVKRKKTKKKGVVERIVAFLINLFQRPKPQKMPSGYIVGTSKQIFKHLLHLLPSWEKETNKDYLVKNPRCQRCKSAEFPEVVERYPTNSKNLLKIVLKDFPKDQKQSALILDLETHYKTQFSSNGNRLMVLCRTCKQKEENRKIERYPHEVPPIMRKGPSELRY